MNVFFCLFLLSSSGLPVALPDQVEAVLVGAAVLGACASQDYSTVQVEWNHSTQAEVIKVTLILRL